MPAAAHRRRPCCQRFGLPRNMGERGMPNPDTARRIRAEAARVLAQNRRTGHADWCGRDYACVVPSPSSYPFQWFWDSCFHAIALTRVNLEWAREELTTLL